MMLKKTLGGPCPFELVREALSLSAYPGGDAKNEPELPARGLVGLA